MDKLNDLEESALNETDWTTPVDIDKLDKYRKEHPICEYCGKKLSQEEIDTFGVNSVGNGCCFDCAWDDDKAEIDYGIEESALNEADGWIAFYNGNKVEITKDEAHDLWSAKQVAIKKLNVPKSKVSLVAVEPAYNESALNEEENAITVRVEDDDAYENKDLYEKLESKYNLTMKFNDFDDFGNTEVFITGTRENIKNALNELFAPNLKIGDEEINDMLVEESALKEDDSFYNELEVTSYRPTGQDEGALANMKIKSKFGELEVNLLNIDGEYRLVTPNMWRTKEEEELINNLVNEYGMQGLIDFAADYHYKKSHTN